MQPSKAIFLFLKVVALCKTNAMHLTDVTTSAYAQYSFQQVSDLINESDNCTNSLYIFSSVNEIGAVNVPVIIKTRFDPERSRAFRANLLGCSTNFLLYPDLIHGGPKPYSVKELRQLMYSESAVVVTHILLKSSFDRIQELLVDILNVSPHILIHSVQPSGRNILSSVICVDYRFLGPFYETMEPEPGITWREAVIRRTNQQHYYFGRYSQVKANISLKEIIKPLIGNPFTYKLVLPYDFEKVIGFLCAEMLNAIAGLDEVENYSIRNVFRTDARMMLDGVQYELQYPGVESTLYFVPVGENFMNFITCDGVGKTMSFNFYFTPYDFLSWLVFAALTFCLIPAMVLLIETSKSGSNITNAKIFSYVLCFNISAALDVSPTIPRWNQLRFQSKTLITTWVVALVVLVNGYKGIFVSDLTSPTQLRRMWTSVREMDGFFFMSSYKFEYSLGRAYRIGLPFHTADMYEYIEFIGIRNALCFPDYLEFAYEICHLYLNRLLRTQPLLKNLSAELLARKITLPRNEVYCKGAKLIQQDLELYLNNPKNYTSKHWDFKIRHQLRLCHDVGYFIREGLNASPSFLAAPFLNALVTRIPFGQLEYNAIPEILSTCYRNGFIDSERNIDYVLALADEAGYRNYKKGEDKMIPNWQLFSFGNLPMVSKRLYRNMLKLLDSGVYHVWKKWYAINNLEAEDKVIAENAKKSKNVVTVKPLTVESNIMTCFIILIPCFSVALAAIVAENVVHIVKTNFRFIGHLIINLT